MSQVNASLNTTHVNVASELASQYKCSADAAAVCIAMGVIA